MSGSMDDIIDIDLVSCLEFFGWISEIFRYFV